MYSSQILVLDCLELYTARHSEMWPESPDKVGCDWKSWEMELLPCIYCQ